MNAHVTLADGTLVREEINAPRHGWDTVTLSDTEMTGLRIYIFPDASGTQRIVVSTIEGEEVGYFKLEVDPDQTTWSVYRRSETPEGVEYDRRVVWGLDRLRTLGALLSTF